MRYLLLLLGLISTAYGQFAPTSAKTAFKNGISIGTRDSTAYAANDSLVVVINRQGRMMYRSTDGYWKLLSNAGSSDYVPYQGAVDNVALGNFRLTARSLRTDSIYANGSGGMYLLTNSGNAVAHWGGGGSIEVDFKGFAGYDANRSASYTARSFTDKGYVDSSAALRVRYTDTAAMLAGYKTYYPRTAISLTTTGSSGAATYNNATGVLNIPQYAPDLSGYVPYTGATANVNLGAFDLTADVITGATGSFSSSGSSNTLDITHSSGSGIALNITKSGNGEGLYINKTSGSGNAATIIGTLNATTLVKSGGTSSQFLKADGSVDGNTYALVSDLNGYVPTSRTLTINGTSFDLSANRSWSVGTVTAVTASAPLSSSGGTTPNITISQATTSTNGFLTSTDWNTFNNKQAQLNGTGFVRFSGTTPSYITGTSSQFVKADGSLDGTSYATAASLSGYLPLSGGTLTGALASNSSITLDNGVYYRAKRADGSAINVLGFESATNNLISVTAGEWKLRNTGAGDAANLFKVDASAVVTAYGQINGTSLSMSGAISGLEASFAKTGGSIITVADEFGRTSRLTASGSTYGFVGTVGSSTNHNFRVETGSASNILDFGNNTGTTWGRFASDGTFLINTTTTDGTNKLIVNGGVKINDISTTGQFYINGTNGAWVQYQVAGSSDWIHGTNVGGAGSDWNLYNYGTSSSAFRINKTTNAATFSSSVTATSFFESSSKKLKDIFWQSKQEDNIDFIGFTWKKSLNLDTKKHLGVIAEQVEKVLPDAVNTNDKGVKSVNYNEVLIYKLERLTKKVAELEQKLERYSKKAKTKN